MSVVTDVGNRLSDPPHHLTWTVRLCSRVDAETSLYSSWLSDKNDCFDI